MMMMVIRLVAGLMLALASHVAFAFEDVDSLLARCAPNVNADTMKAIMSAESRGHVYALADAGPVALPWSERKKMVRSLYPTTKDEALKMVQDLLAKGHTVSIGPWQINDRNLPRMGLTASDVLEPCENAQAASKILSKFYEDAVAKFGVGVQALRATLSAYNSGDFFRGEADGYVDIVYQKFKRPVQLNVGGPKMTVVPALDSPESGQVAPGSGTRRTASSGVKRAVQTAARKPKYSREDFTMIVTSFDGTELK